MWFPTLSPDGAHVAAQGDKPSAADDYYPILLDGAPVGVGLSTGWLGGVLLWAQGTRVQSWSPERVSLFAETGRPINKLLTDGETGWACWHGGEEWTWQIPRPRPLAPAIEYRFAGGLEAWVEHGPGGPVCRPAPWAPWEPRTHLAVPVACPDPWILRVEDDRLVLHPRGQWQGYVVHVGDTYYPDARLRGDRVRVVWTDGRGALAEASLDLLAPRVDLRRDVVEPTPEPPPEPPPTGGTVDYRTFSWDRCEIHRDAEDIGAWPITSTITEAVVTDDRVRLDHTMAGRWPVVAYEGIVVEGCVWTIAPHGDGWRAATWDRLRPGQTEKTMGRDEYQQGYALNLPGWVPANGDVVGYLVSTPARMDERGPVNERSGIVWVRFGSDAIVGREGAQVPPEPPIEPTPPPVIDPAIETRLAALERWARSLAYRG